VYLSGPSNRPLPLNAKVFHQLPTAKNSILSELLNGMNSWCAGMVTLDKTIWLATPRTCVGQLKKLTRFWHGEPDKLT